jgi:beta-glucanase (GH16 family)
MEFTAGPAWTQVGTAKFRTRKHEPLIVRLQDAGGGTGSVDIDDVFLGVPGKGNAVRNPGFEYGNAFWTVEIPFSVVRADNAAPSAAPAAPPYSGKTGLHIPAGYHLVFSDDFSGNNLDRDKWADHLYCYTDHLNDELERYRPYGILVGDGVCILQAKPAELPDVSATLYSSGIITTRTPFGHGYFEVRIKLPPGKGFWPAFWLTSAEDRWPPEWDIFEVIDGKIHGYPHPVSDPAAKCEWVEGAAADDKVFGLNVVYTRDLGAPDMYGGFVTYGFLYTPTDVVWYVNDVMTEHYRINEAAGSNDRMWVILCLAVGGKWPGSPDARTPWPGNMLVDYVKIWQP